MRIKYWLFVLVLTFLCVSISGQQPIRDLRPTVILISLDGFRYDYLDKFGSPTLNRVAKQGVRAKWMIPAFPTKTFPNHYTIATGLYPANHGIVENSVFDFGTVFSMSKRGEVENPRWWGGEPIWVTAEKQGQIAASYFFVGSETVIAGDQPTFWRRYDGGVPPQMRVDKVLGWLDLPLEKRPTMITLYFSDVDDAGHAYSPDAEETKYAVWNVDGYVERLLNGLKARRIDQKVNVIIVSDHGMAPVNLKQTTFLDDRFDFDLAERILWTNEIVQIFPKSGQTDAIFSKINDLEHVTCWKKTDIPDRLNYKQGKRVAPIVCSTEEGWITTSHKRYEDWIKDIDDLDRPRGGHGYDNKYQSMQALFVARGEAFKRGFISEPFENTQVYNLMCRILGLTPAPNDGNLEKVRNLLK
jgi:predicted AlkP superfamily pyrophosphatase or phosphodiesterase